MNKIKVTYRKIILKSLMAAVIASLVFTILPINNSSQVQATEKQTNNTKTANKFVPDSSILNTSYPKSMANMFCFTNLPTEFNLPSDFGQDTLKISYIFQKTILSTGFSLPDGFILPICKKTEGNFNEK
ncbi:MAG: hypothetical protein LBT99_00350 [Bifidobacteriaceae bacterium]|jgi:hypothetical protein|nr:hypothetical protein [Bifidobacteriaceae bacterium]